MKSNDGLGHFPLPCSFPGFCTSGLEGKWTSRMAEKKLKNRREFTPEFKLRLVCQIVTGGKTMAELSREHQIKDSLLGLWRDQFLERAPSVFGALPSGQERIAELERELGRQHLELELLKKASKRLL
jgi:transposase